LSERRERKRESERGEREKERERERGEREREKENCFTTMTKDGFYNYKIVAM
jgi:hypothetical protein